MRLSNQQLDIIKSIVTEKMHSAYKLFLFGSRIDDTKRGEDIDLAIQVTGKVSHPARLCASIEAQISKKMKGRKVDVVLIAPDLKFGSAHKAALDTGILLDQRESVLG